MSRSILIIEDSPTTRAVVKIYLTGHNLDFHEAADAEKGLELARRLRPAAIICDLKLPGADGFTVCRQSSCSPGPKARRCTRKRFGRARPTF
jgi:CheY-like chemotaxis protein